MTAAWWRSPAALSDRTAAHHDGRTGRRPERERKSDHLRRVIVGIPDHCGAQVLLVDHDVDLISQTCTATLVLDFGVKIAYGPTDDVLKDPAVRTAYLGEAA